MFKNYLKIALRNIIRHKGYSFINILGLAIGMACCILIMLWIQYELSFNKMHEKLDSIYLVRCWEQYGVERMPGQGTPPILGRTLKAEFPEVVNSALINNGLHEFLIQYENKKFKDHIQLAEPTVFEIFTIPFVKGNSKDAFSDPHVMVMAEKTAQKYFGNESPIGRIVTLENRYEFKVVGVIEDIPYNSTIDFAIWIPIEFTREIYRPNYLDTWYNLAFRTYVQLAENVSYQEFNQKIANRIRQSDPNTILEPFLYPFKDVYLKLWGRLDQVKIFGVIALFVLIIACINFMNLTTARSARRTKEVGLRKVVGAQRKHLVRQFFGESILLTIISLALAIFFVELFLPVFRQMTQRPLELHYLKNLPALMGIMGIAIVTGIISGSYPALFLSSFQPVQIFTGLRFSSSKGSSFRKILVVTQFALSIILIIATTVVYNQVHFMRNKKLGLNKEQILYLPVEGNLGENIETVKNELLKNPAIQSISLVSDAITGIYWNGQDWQWQEKDPNVNPLITYFQVDADFLKTFQIEMANGRFFTEESKNQAVVVINERLAQIMNLETAAGNQIYRGDISLEIIGIVKDFHFKPVHEGEIGPIMIFNNPDIRPYRYMYLKIYSKDIPQTIAFIKDVATKFNPNYPFEYHFLDEAYDQMYHWIDRTTNIVRTFALLAIFLSCLGLFGLASFMAEQRTKEIGVRKVLGASVPGIVVLLSREFTKWVLIANIIAWPVAYYFMNQWLQDFTYRTKLGWEIFVLSAVLALVVAMLTVSYQAIRTAHMNPVESLRYE